MAFPSRTLSLSMCELILRSLRSTVLLGWPLTLIFLSPTTAFSQANIGPSSPVKVGRLPNDAAIIFWSTRNVPSAGPLGPSHIYVMKINGGNLTQMTFDAYDYEHAAVSPDRRYIAVSRYISGGVHPSAVWIIDLRNRSQARLVPDFYHAGAGGVDWTGKGEIYFAAQPIKDGDQNIYKIKPDGTGLTKLTNVVVNPNSNPVEPSFQSDVSTAEDGSLATYLRAVAKLDEATNTWMVKPQAWVMNIDGSNQHMADDGGSEWGTWNGFALGDYDPELSPDKTMVIFSRPTCCTPYVPPLNTAQDIFSNTLGVPALKQLTQSGRISIIPDWYNGKILFTEYSDSPGHTYCGLVLMNPDGSGHNHLEPGLPFWSGGRHGKFVKAKK